MMWDTQLGLCPVFVTQRWETLWQLFQQCWDPRSAKAHLHLEKNVPTSFPVFPSALTSQHCWSFKCRLYPSISGIPSHDPDTGSWQSVPNTRRREPDCRRKHHPQGQVARLQASALEAGCTDPSARGGGRHVRGRSGRSGQPQQCGCCHREWPPTCFHGCL